jgi:RHS repeat-associated protein
MSAEAVMKSRSIGMARLNTALCAARHYLSLSFAATVFIAATSHSARADSSPVVSIAEARALDNIRPAAAPGQQTTMLPDGRWLLTGGEFEAEPTDRIEVYSGSRASAFPVTLNHARTGHTATVLSDGTVFIFGGIGPDGRLVQGAEIIDPAYGTVTETLALGLTIRAQHAATLLTNGQLLISGGTDASGEALSSIQIWDPRGHSAPIESSLLVARFAHEAALLANGEGLVWQGQGADRKSLANGELYDPNTKLIAGSIDSTDSRLMGLIAARNQSPYIADTLPQGDAVDVPLDSVLAVRFSKPLPIAKLNSTSIVLIGPAGAVAGSVVGAEGGMLAFFTPSMELRPGTIYTLFITGLADQEGRELASSSSRFTTRKIVAPTEVVPSAAPAQPSISAGGSATASQTVDPLPAAAKPSTAQKTTLRPIIKPPQPPAPPVSTPALAEDWIPLEQNRHAAWRVLGLANDPPLKTEARAMAALKAPTNQTAIAGQVLRLNGLPLAGVSVSAGTLRTSTDTMGRFLLSGVQAGAVELKVDGTGVINNGRHYTAHYLPVMAKQGTTSVLPYPIYLVRVDPASEVPISSPADHEIVLTHPSMPGLEVRIPKGAVIRDPDGKVVTKISITPIPIDRAPSPVPAPFAVYFTLQPAGAWVDGDATKGVKVIYPNYQGAAAGTLFNFWNDALSEQGWHVYGHGKVSPDQTQILPDDSVTFRRLMHFSAATAPQYLPGEEPSTAPVANGCKAADPVDCGTGLFEHTVTDLSVNDVVPITLTRMYRTNDNQVHAFGVGTDLSYNMRLVSPPSITGSFQEIDVVLANGTRVPFFLSPYPGRNDGYRNPGSPVAALSGAVMLADNSQIFLKDGSVLQFSTSTSTPQLASITDRYGNTISITRSVIGAETQTAMPITQITSPNGRYIQLFYDSLNRITSAVDNAGRTTSYAYDAQSHLISATDANGYTESYGYDPTSNNMNLVTDKRGNAATKNLYDANGRVSQQTLADGAIWKFSYVLDTNGNVTQTTVTDPRNYVKQHTFSSSGYPTQTILALGQPEQQTYTITYNVGNLPLQVTDTLGRSTVSGYDAFGDLTSITSLAGTANAVTYQMTYDPIFHQLTGVTDPLGHTTAITIGASGNAVSVTDALGNSTTALYNPQGLPTSATDPLGNPTQIAYGTAGDISSVTDPLNRQTHFGRDEVGRLIGIVDPLGNTTQYAIDAMDRLSSVTNAIGGITNLTYDQNGNVLTVSDPNSVKQTFTYDSRNRRHTYLDPAGNAESYNYDGMSNLTSKVDRKSQTTSITYDGINRPTLVTFQDASTIAITWDAGNRPTTFVDSANGTISRVYDGLDRLTQETTPQGQVNYTYDAASRRQTMTVTGQPVINYTFDNDNRLTQVAQGTNVLGFGYDAAGRRATITLPNSIIGTYGFDNAGQLTSITYMTGATTVGTLGYGYDLGGRRTSITGTLAGFVPPTAVPSLTYDGTNRLTSWAGTPLTYDANGNLTAFGASTYTWNARNQLTATSNGAATFGYDALGRRVNLTVSGVTTPYLYDGQNPAMISSNLLLAGAGIDEIYAQINSSGTTSYLRDGNNSAVAVTNSTAATTANLSYSPYGDSASTGTATTPLQYTGRENDGATALYYYRARYYSPQLGRFISEDPIGLGGGTNYYAYADGNPMSETDPLGLLGMDDVYGAIYAATGGWTPSQATVNVSAGFGDVALFGQGARLRAALGVDGGVNQCSTSYHVGEAAGFVASLATGLVGGLEAAGAKGAGMEFSHWIPTRMGGPRSLWNGNFVTTATHALSDPFRYRFMPRAWKALNPMPAVLEQQWVRIPNVYKGGAAGAAYGGGGAALAGCTCQH